MKKIAWLFVLLLINPVCVYALDFDVNRKGSFKIHYIYGDKNIYGSHVSLYKIASLNGDGDFRYLEQYDLTDSLDLDTSSKWNDLAAKIVNYVSDKSIKSDLECDIKEGSLCEFNDLDVGLYLITSTVVKSDDYQYSSSPTLISIPNRNGIDSSLIYDIDAFLKVSAKAINVDNNTTNDPKPIDNKPVNVPKTLDDINVYFGLFIVSIVVMVVMVFYIKKFRKKEKNNEKNN